MLYISRLIQESYEILSDSRKKLKYDHSQLKKAKSAKYGMNFSSQQQSPTMSDMPNTFEERENDFYYNDVR